MKVMELMEYLKEFNPNLDVVIRTDYGLNHIEEPVIEVHHERPSEELVLISTE